MRYPNPYLVFFNSSDKYLYYLGAGHSFHPSDTIHQVIKHYWSDFLSAIGTLTPVVLIEGGQRPILPNEEQAILKHGEAGLVAYLAAEHGWDHQSPEPDLLYEANQLKIRFSENEIWTYFFTRRAAQWNRLQNKPDFWTYVLESLNQTNEILKWNPDALSRNNLTKSFQVMAGFDLNPDSYELFHQLTNPFSSNTLINQVSSQSTQVRDEHIVNKILGFWRQGNSIFAVYGKNHVITQEPILKPHLH